MLPQGVTVTVTIVLTAECLLQPKAGTRVELVHSPLTSFQVAVDNHSAVGLGVPRA